MKPSQRFTQLVGIEHPLICGAMYPCSNPELVAAVSEAGGIGVVQPLSLVYVYKHEFREGLRAIRKLTSKPIGVNLLIESSSQAYLDRMKAYLDISLEEGVKFFVTALGKPGWVCEKVHAAGGVVFHDVTERKWAQRAIDEGVDGLICVNALAGGHAGTKQPEELVRDLASFGKPLVCAGGVGDEKHFRAMLELGYDAVQMGTRFIASAECKASPRYKQAILDAHASDIVLTEKLTGVPVAVINNEHVKKEGTHAGWLARKMLQHPKLKHYARMYYSLMSFRHFKNTIQKPKPYDEYWQAGRSVEGIERVEAAGDIVGRFVSGL